MKNISTKELDDKLKDIRPSDIDSFSKENSEYLAYGKKAFYYYMKDVLAEKRIRHSDVYLRADVSESYGSKIMSMIKHTKNRDLIISFCLAGHLTLDETNRALKLYGFNPLYSKNERDIIIIVAINNRRYQIHEVDEMLIEHGMDVLYKTRK